MKKLSSSLYDIGRKASKAGSVLNDVNNIKEGNYGKVVKKQVKKKAHKGLNNLMK